MDWQLDLQHLQDLGNPSVCHDFLWALHPAHGPILPPAQYIVALHLHLGNAALPLAPPCACCGSSLSEGGMHSLHCPVAQKVTGHNAVWDALLPLVQACDPVADVKLAGLLSDSQCHPTDILTSAAPCGGLAVLDVGVALPDVAVASDDCTASMYQWKVAAYSPVEHAELAAQGIQYHPVVFTCYGWAHPEANGFLSHLAATAAH